MPPPGPPPFSSSASEPAEHPPDQGDRPPAEFVSPENWVVSAGTRWYSPAVRLSRLVTSRFLQGALFGAGFLALGTSGLYCIHAAFYQHMQSRTFDAALRRAQESQGRVQQAGSGADTGWGLADRPGPKRRSAPLAPGAPVGRLEIPRLNISAMIGEGVDGSTLSVAIGHQTGSAFPGEPGNVVLAAHRDSFFRGLKEISDGDMIHITTLDGSFDYEVIGQAIVNTERTDLLAPTSSPALTLVTCYPFHWIGQAPLRFIVRAKPVEPGGGGSAGDRTAALDHPEHAAFRTLR